MVARTENEKAGGYDPFLRGRFPVGVRTNQAPDAGRKRQFPCEIWYPAAAQYYGQDLAPATQDVFTVPVRDAMRRQLAVRNAAAHPGTHPLIIFSHSSGSGRRQSTFLCTHLASHGYVVAALDHSEIVAPELARKAGESDEQKTKRWEALIASRVPDVHFLLDHLISGGALSELEAKPDPALIGIVGHSFGGWTSLAATEADRRIRSVVALAPAGASRPRPGILPATLAFKWGRDVPTLYLVAEGDVSTPLTGMYEMFERTSATKQMIVLRRADHLHFMDDVEELHEAVRKMPLPPELAYVQREMLPITELCSGQQAELFVRGLTLCHLDATLRQEGEAERFLAGDIAAELAQRDVAAIVHKP
jgi:dienelactone hydrolase